MHRRQSSQDVSWFLDCKRNKQLDLDPPYQRKSVWTSKDRQYFLDTVFRNFPCPPIYLHKTLDDKGSPTYHVIDGKQRIETIIKFYENEIYVSDDYGDARLNKKKWKDITHISELRSSFLNYSFSVELFDELEQDLVNDVFSRLNRNQRGLTRQEIRHAQFRGWLATLVESEIEKKIWQTFSVATPSKSKRMLDTQFISELILGTIQKKIVGFDQDDIDTHYAEYDDVEDELLGFSADAFIAEFDSVKEYLLEMERHNRCISIYAKGVANLYSIWMLITLEWNNLRSPAETADLYLSFMVTVKFLLDSVKSRTMQKDVILTNEVNNLASIYFQNVQSATTDALQRKERHDALVKDIINQYDASKVISNENPA